LRWGGIELSQKESWWRGGGGGPGLCLFGAVDKNFVRISLGGAGGVEYRVVRAEFSSHGAELSAGRCSEEDLLEVVGRVAGRGRLVCGVGPDLHGEGNGGLSG